MSTEEEEEAFERWLLGGEPEGRRDAAWWRDRILQKLDPSGEDEELAARVERMPLDDVIFLLEAIEDEELALERHREHLAFLRMTPGGVDLSLDEGSYLDTKAKIEGRIERLSDLRGAARSGAGVGQWSERKAAWLEERAERLGPGPPRPAYAQERDERVDRIGRANTVFIVAVIAIAVVSIWLLIHR